MRRAPTVLAAALAISLVATSAGAAQPPAPDWSSESGAAPPPVVLFPPAPDRPARLRWRYHPVQTWELYLTGGLALSAVAAVAAGSRSDHWRGGVLFDDDVRRSTRLGTDRQRSRARDASDVLLALSFAGPTLGDGLITSYWYHQSPEVTEQILLINAETLAFTFAVLATVTSLASRERPYGAECGRGLDSELRECAGGDRYRSFFSGHTTGAFAAASVSCMHHAHLPLYGGGAPEVASCAVGYAAAGATAALRVMGDVHYASDVMVGAAWGTLSGLGVPWLLHYRKPQGERFAPKPSLHLVPHPTGIAVGGAF